MVEISLCILKHFTLYKRRRGGGRKWKGWWGGGGGGMEGVAEQIMHMAINYVTDVQITLPLKGDVCM